MHGTRAIWMPLYWVLTVALFAGAMAMLMVYTPVEASAGSIQKVFYLHLPVAMNTFVAAAVVFVASIGYLWQRSFEWDDLAAAAGEVTALFCLVVLVTGMIWGRSAWGAWWTWSPRLSFSLVLLVLYVVYVLIRSAIESPHRRAVVCAVYGAAAFLDVPVVYLSVKLMPDIHPSSIELTPEMKTTLLAWFVPVTLLMGGLIYCRFTLIRRRRALDESCEGGAALPGSASHAGATA